MALSNVDPHNFAEFTSKAALLEKENYYVKFDADGELVVCTAGAPGYVLVEGGESGEPCTIVVGSERQKVICKAAIKVGEPLASNGSGEAVVAAEGNYVLGIALEAGASGDVIETLTAPPVAVVPA